MSWNVVMQEKGRITLAGEFGLIIQSNDGGRSWVRRNAIITESEPEQPYWLGGNAKGDKVVLTGAAGAIMMSEDNGDTWKMLAKPSKEGVFSVNFVDDLTTMVSGAVGLLATLDNDSWEMEDRTKLKMMSWVRAFVVLKNGSTLLLGGRSTSLLYNNKTWKRIKLTIKEEQS